MPLKKMNNLQEAYAFCQALAKTHYENFPVASILLPKSLRLPISVIYAFARTADDFADEGNEPQTVRIAQLDAYLASLAEIKQNGYQGENPIFIALEDVIKQHDVPISLFEDLISAFKQDVVKSRYQNFDEVLDYCTRSADPVGRLLLHLIGKPSALQLTQSDAVCTSLQLINFYQDIVQDYTEQDRIYIPIDELHHHNLIESDLIHPNSQQISPLIRSLYKRTQDLMKQGAELGLSLSGRMGWEVRAMTLGGITTLHHLIQQSDDHLLSRPRLSRFSLIKIMMMSSTRMTYRYAIQKLLD
jgi:squalene synthase HpnC